MKETLEQYMGAEAYAQAKAEQAAAIADRKAAEQLKRDRNAAFWAPVMLKPIPFWQELYDMVLSLSEKRMPKWRFQLAPDLVMQAQPKLTRTGRRFEFVAIAANPATEALLLCPLEEIQSPWIKISGALTDNGEDWRLKFAFVTWQRKHPNPDTRYSLRERIANAFLAGHFDHLNPEIMLRTHCICCGKGLTDPVSQARYIGPECWQRTGGRIRWTLDVDSRERSADFTAKLQEVT
jgi:hypothetical protein